MKLGGILLAIIVAVLALACTKEVVKEVPREVVVEKEVIKEVPVEKIVTEQVIKEIPKEIVVEKEVVREVPKEIIVKEQVIKEVPKEVIVKEEVIKEVVKQVVVKEQVIKEIPKEIIVKEEVIKEVVKQVVVVATPAPVMMDKEIIPTRETSLVFGTGGDQYTSSDNFNPYTLGGLSLLWAGVHQGAIESLFYWNSETGEVPGWQAEGFDFSSDFKEFTIKLRDGVKWSDGRPFSADDLVFTINMLKNNAPILQYSADVRERVGIARVVDAETVRITLNEPNPRYVFDQWMSIYSSVYVVPKHIWEGKDPLTFTNFDQEKSWPVFTGPYRFKQGSATEMIWDIRPDWWAAETGFKQFPAVERLTFIPVGGEDTTSAAMIAGQIDYAAGLGRSTLETVLDRNPNVISFTDETGGGRGYGAYAWIDPCPRFLGFNSLAKPFDDPDIRWAINHAIKKDDIVNIALEGTTWVTWHLLPEYKGLISYVKANEDLLETYPVNEYNPQKTEQLMTAKGYAKDGQGFWSKDGERLSFVVQASGEFEKPAPLLTQNLRDAGFEVDFKFPQGAAYADLLSTGQAEVFTNIGCAFQDPHRMFDQFHKRFVVPIGERALGLGHRAEQSTRWSHDEYSRIVDEMAQTFPADPKMEELVRSGFEILLEELPIIPMFQATFTFAANTEHWQNFPTQQNDYAPPAWWWAGTKLWITRLERSQ
jgi:peptide/nickel transport system substrate-binding protein